MSFSKLCNYDARTQKKYVVCVLSALIVILMITVVFVSGILDVQKVWPDVHLDYQGGKRQYSLAEGDSYGLVATGPYYDLAAGCYQIQWQIEGDGVNRIHLRSTNGANIEPAVFETVPGEWQGRIEFEIKEAAHNVYIGVEFASGTWIKIYNFRLYSPEYRDDAWTFMFTVVALWLMFVAEYLGWIKEETWWILAAIVFTSAVSCVPCFFRDCLNSYDLQFHAARIMNLAEGISSGQLHARVGGFSYNGYGAATSVFYPDLLLYPLALMVLGGASITYIVHISCFAISLLCGWSMYVSTKQVLKNRNAACYAAMLYISNAYRMESMYRRYMLGEMVAMVGLPLFMLGLWEIFQGNSKRWPVLVLGATMVFQSHMCTTLLCMFFSICICVLLAKRIFMDRTRLYALVLAAIATILVNLGTLIPFVDLYLGGVNTPTDQFGFVSSVCSLRTLIICNGSGLIMWPALLVSLGALIIEKNLTRRKQILFLLIVAGMFAVLSTEVFPWQNVVDMTNGLVEVIQFPWRFLVLTTVLISLCGGYGIAKILHGMEKTAILLTLALSIFSIWPYILNMETKEVGMEFGEGANPYMVYPEYQYEGTDVNNTRSKEVILSDGIQMTNYEKRGTKVNAQIDARKDGVIVFPMFGFDGYEVKINGQEVAWRRTENNRLTVDISAGTQGRLQIHYEGKLLWKIADGISVLASIGLVWYSSYRRRIGHTKV